MRCSFGIPLMHTGLLCAPELARSLLNLVKTARRSPGTSATPVQMSVCICFRVSGGPFLLMLSSVLPRILSSVAVGQSFTSVVEGSE